MKIEMVLPSLVGAGMEMMAARMTLKLAARGHDVGVTCVLDRGVLATELESKGIRVSHVPAPGFVSQWRPRDLARHIGELAPDVLHIHSGVWLKGAMAGLQSCRPFAVLTAHGFVENESPIMKTMDWIAAAISDKVVAVSEQVRDHHVRQLIPASKLAMIVNGIDTELFAPRPVAGTVRARLGIDPGTTLMGCVARLQPIKNHALMIEALALARTSGSDCELVLFGEGVLRRDLELQVEALGLRGKVHFWGFEAAMHELYPELDIFALSSTAEGTSLSMLEAMASGVCCLATAVGGNVDLLADGAGVLVPLGQPQAFAEAIAALTADPGRRAAIGRLARERARTSYSEDVMIDRYEELYRQGRPRGAGRRPPRSAAMP